MKSDREELKYRGKRCPNCEHELDVSDRFCSYCGQQNSTKKLNFDDFFTEFFAGIFAYDSRFNRTMRALLYQPGKISKDYIQGKRIRYANPFKFYLSASIIFFLIWSFTSSFDGFQPSASSGSAFDTEIQELPLDSIPNIGSDLSGVPGLDGQNINLDSLIQARQERQRAGYREVYKTDEQLDSLPVIENAEQKLTLFSKFYKETRIISSETALDSLSYPQTNYNQFLYEKAVDWNIAQDNPQIFINYFIGKLPFIIFFYLPVFAFFILLLYIRRPFNYMEHLIFTFHIQTTFFVFFTIAVFFDYIFNIDVLTTIAIFVFLFYLYKALRKFYGQGRVKTIVKFVILNLIFFILAAIATVVSILASFAIY